MAGRRCARDLVDVGQGTDHVQRVGVIKVAAVLCVVGGSAASNALAELNAGCLSGDTGWGGMSGTRAKSWHSACRPLSERRRTREVRVDFTRHQQE